MVTDILTQEVLSSFCGNALWSNDLRTYLSGNSDMFWMHIGIYYKNLYAIDFPTSAPSWIGTYLMTRLRNEFERIFVALTWQYKPYYNYYRSIIERNTGSDSNVYSGSDSIGKTGTDSVRHTGKDEYSGSENRNGSEGTAQGQPASEIQFASTYDDTNQQTMKPTVRSENQYKIDDEQHRGYKDSLEHGENIFTTYGSTQTDTYGKTLTMNFGRNVNTEIEGINGLFAPQDLIMKELALRIRAKLFDIFVGMIVQCVSAGVWESEE